MKGMRGRLKYTLACGCMLALAASYAQAQNPCTLSCEAFGGSTVAGLDNVDIECFVECTADTGFGGYQLDWPCSSPFSIAGAANVAGNISISTGGSQGGVPWIYSVTAPSGTGLFAAPSPANCLVAQGPNVLAQDPIIQTIPANTLLYLGTMNYDIDECAAGTAVPALEDQGGSSRIATGLGPGINVPLNFVDPDLIVPVGTCCDGLSCVVDNIGEVCCLNNNPGFLWSEGKDCNDPNPCACTQNSECDDNNPCNGREECNVGAGTCFVAEPAPTCALCEVCVDGVGCNAAAANGNACGDQNDSQCDNPNTCSNGACGDNFEPAGTPCGSGSSGDCDAADTCDGSGGCANNNFPNGQGCTDDGDPCTHDRCSNGNCSHPQKDEGAACDDGDGCTDDDACDAGGACVGTDAAAPGGSCDDTLDCTVDSCVDDACANDDINAVACDPNGDGSECSSLNAGATCEANGLCKCEECVVIALNPRKTEAGDNCHDEGDMVWIDVFFAGSAPSRPIAGGQFRVEYDPTCLEFVSVEGAGIWSEIIFTDAGSGYIFFAVGSPSAGGGIKGQSSAGVMASLKFNKVGECNWCQACLASVNPQNSRLTDTKGGEGVICDPNTCTKMIHDRGDTTLDCPGDQDLNVDCDAATASVSQSGPTASDSCEGPQAVDCTCVHEPPHNCSTTDAPCNALEIVLNSCDGGVGVCVPEFAAIDCDGLLDGGTYPQGRYFFECSTGDDGTCTTDLSCEWTVTVSDETSLDVVVQLSPNVEDTEFTRCICFELYTSCTPMKWIEVCETMTFGGAFNLSGHAADSLKVPKSGNIECITARDRQHSLRASQEGVPCDGSYSAEFKGDTFFDGNWLIQGNLNRDQVIDILDFGVFLGQLNQNPTPRPKTCEDNDGEGFTHADINGDGVVDVADFTFIQINFLANDKNVCCPGSHTAGQNQAGRTSISVKELREMGMDDLAVADLNNDGNVDQRDMAAYLQGARPKDGAKVRNGASRPGRARK